MVDTQWGRVGAAGTTAVVSVAAGAAAGFLIRFEFLTRFEFPACCASIATSIGLIPIAGLVCHSRLVEHTCFTGGVVGSGNGATFDMVGSVERRLSDARRVAEPVPDESRNHAT